MGRPSIPLAGQRFGLLTTKEMISRNSRGNSYWLCDCDCDGSTTQQLK